MMVLQDSQVVARQAQGDFRRAQWKVMTALLKQLEQGVNAVGFGAI